MPHQLPRQMQLPRLIQRPRVQCKRVEMVVAEIRVGVGRGPVESVWSVICQLMHILMGTTAVSDTVHLAIIRQPPPTPLSPGINTPCAALARTTHHYSDLTHHAPRSPPHRSSRQAHANCNKPRTRRTVPAGPSRHSWASASYYSLRSPYHSPGSSLAAAPHSLRPCPWPYPRQVLQSHCLHRRAYLRRAARTHQAAHPTEGDHQASMSGVRSAGHSRSPHQAGSDPERAGRALQQEVTF